MSAEPHWERHCQGPKVKFSKAEIWLNRKKQSLYMPFKSEIDQVARSSQRAHIVFNSHGGRRPWTQCLSTRTENGNVHHASNQEIALADRCRSTDLQIPVLVG